jgi:dTDP-4-dehydrorhamnose 3,5-epimerase
MRITTLELPEVLLLEADTAEDDRGSFARWWDREALAEAGADSHVEQISVSTNRLRGTLRGIHFQLKPHEEAKTVRCIRGSVFDVAVDLRASSPRRFRWVATQLSSANGNALHIPKGFGHGFLTMEDDTVVQYVIATPYRPDAASGHRWNDPALAIDWPGSVAVVSERDQRWPLIRS